MIVAARCLASLARYAPPDGRLDLPAGATAGDAADGLGIPGAALGSLLVNGHPATRDTRLVPGDVLSLVPPISGG